METKILHVEDNPDDIVLTALAFRKACVAAKLEVATDGDKAKAVLTNATPTQLPACVLLDIKLPSISGLEFKPEIAKYMAYPEAKMQDMRIFSPDWTFINPIRSRLVEKYNQVFGA